MIGLLAAIRQLTRIPVPRDWVGPADRPGRSFAIVGAGLGAVAGIVAWSLVQPLGPFLAVIPGIFAAVLLTGARAEDGLSRWMEGGSLATMLLTLLAVFRVIAVASVPPYRWIGAFLLVHALSHAAMLVPHFLADPRRERIDVVSWLINATVLVAAALLCGRWGIVASLFALSAATCVAVLAGRRAAAADVLGATVIATEVAAWTGLVIGWKG
jgi:cobalamin synthase